MATPPMGPNFAATHLAIDSAVSAILDDDPAAKNVDIVGTAVAMANVTMDRVELMLNRLRGRGRRLKPSRPLTLDRPYARGQQSPALRTGLSPMYGRAISPEPLTGMEHSPAHRRGPAVTPPANWARSPSLYEAKTIGKGIRSEPVLTPPSQRETLREFPNTPASGNLSQRSSGYPTALEPATPPAPASRRQSISNLQVPSTRTGLEVTPRSSRSPAYRTGIQKSSRKVGKSPATARTPPDSSTKTAWNLYGQVHTAQEPRSPGGRYFAQSPQVGTARSSRSGTDLRGRQQASTPKTARGVSSSGRGPAVTPPANWARSPSLYEPETIGKGVRSEPVVTPPSQRETLRELPDTPASGNLSQRSSGYPTALEPATPPAPASRRQSISNLQVPSTRTGLESTPPPRSPAYRTGIQKSSRKVGKSPATARTPDSSTRTARELKGQLRTAQEPRSPGGRYLAQSPKVGTARSGTNVQGRQQPSSTRTAISPMHGTARGISPSARGPAVTPPANWARSPSLYEPETIGKGVRSEPVLTPPSQRETLREFPNTPASGNLSQRSSGYPTALEPATPPSPASRRQSISNLQVPSTRTGLEATPRSSRYPTALEPATSPVSRRQSISNLHVPSTRTGLDATPRSSGYPTAVEPATPPSPASRRQSISNPQVPSTRTGLEVTPRSSGYPTALEPASRRQSISNLHVPSTRTGLEVTPRSSGYPTALEPASRRQSISNLHVPSTRTGLEVTPRSSGFHTAISPAHYLRSFSCSTAISPGTASETQATAELFPPLNPNAAPIDNQAFRGQQSPSKRTPVSPMSVSLIAPRRDADTMAPPSINNMPSTRTALDTRSPSSRDPRVARSPLHVSTARLNLNDDDTSAQGSSSEDGVRTARQLSPCPSQTDVKQPLSAAQQWAHVEPGAGPKILPAKSPNVTTARELKPATSQRSGREAKVNPNNLWNDLRKASEVPRGNQTLASSPGLATAKNPSFRELKSRSPAASSTKTAIDRSSRTPAVSPLPAREPSLLRTGGALHRGGSVCAPITPPKSPHGNRLAGAGPIVTPTSTPAHSASQRSQKGKPNSPQDRVIIETSDSSESVHSQVSVDLNTYEADPKNKNRRRRMHPSRILLNGEEVWIKKDKKDKK